MNRPENVDFILKDIKSNILDNYVCFLEKRIDKAIEQIEVMQYNETYGKEYVDYNELIEILKGEN